MLRYLSNAFWVLFKIYYYLNSFNFYNTFYPHCIVLSHILTRHAGGAQKTRHKWVHFWSYPSSCDGAAFKRQTLLLRISIKGIKKFFK